MTTLRFVALTLFTVGMMFALHPLPREPWGVLGMGDLFTGYVMAFVGGSAYAYTALRQPRRAARASVVALRTQARTEPRHVRRAA
jgi:hypothetical protein